MDEFKNKLQTFRYGDNALEDLLTVVKRILAERRANRARVLNTANRKKINSSLPTEVLNKMEPLPEDTEDITGDIENPDPIQSEERQAHTGSANLNGDNEQFINPSHTNISKQESGSAFSLRSKFVTDPYHYTPPKRTKHIEGVGAVLNGRYELIKYVESGNKSIIYKAIDRRKLEVGAINPYVTIKLIKREFISHQEWANALQEGVTRSQGLIHPNITRVYGFDQHGPTVYLIMEYLSGNALSAITNTAEFAGMAADETLNIINSTGAALVFAHQQGIVHGNLNPSNIILTHEKKVKINNFGFNQAFQHADAENSDADIYDTGALAYASPEALEHRTPDSRDDVYSLACIAYELLTREHPFDHKLASEALDTRMRLKKSKKFRQKQFGALQRALCLQQSNRTPSIAAFLEEFHARKRSREVAIGVIGVIIGLAVSGGYIYSNLHNKRTTDTTQTPDANDVSMLLESKSPATPAPTTEMDANPVQTPTARSAELATQGLNNKSTNNIEESVIAPHSTVDASHTEAGNSQAEQQLEENNVQDDQRLKNLLSLAETQIAKLHFILPAEDNALQTYQAILKMSPENEKALNGIERIVSAYKRWAAIAQHQGEWTKAEVFFKRALAIHPQDIELANNLRQAREARGLGQQNEHKITKEEPPPMETITPDSPQASTKPTPAMAQIENVEHSMGSDQNPQTAIIRAAVVGDINRVDVFVEENLEVSSYAMNDNGTQGDSIANDGHYGREIPLQDTNSKILYVIAAYKPDGTVIYSPQGGTKTYSIEPQLAVSAVVLNEFMVSNETTLTDSQGHYDDWIELHNRTAESIDLSGYYLTNNIDEPKKWRFPQEVFIDGHGYLIIWADGETANTVVDANRLELHTNFSLSAEGGKILLINTDANNNTILDGAAYDRQPSGTSIVRMPNGLGDFILTATPTPGIAN